LFIYFSQIFKFSKKIFDKKKEGRRDASLPMKHILDTFGAFGFIVTLACSHSHGASSLKVLFSIRSYLSNIIIYRKFLFVKFFVRFFINVDKK
jgi:hypothetical protein